MMRLSYAAIRVHAIGPQHELAPALAELNRLVDGTPQRGPVAYRLARAGVTSW